ncbi:prion-inhibition and propagation-domain-containing protein [Halenospora varia]|nr:prion-inhibition and propagation-domain-containing protein [Halenospora varia]
MAEVVCTIASVATLAALFKSCVDAFDMVQAARHQEVDYNRLLVKFGIEKCRLYTWGETMRLTSPAEQDEHRPLDSFQFRGFVQRFPEVSRVIWLPGSDEYASGYRKWRYNGFCTTLTDSFLQFQNGPQDRKELKLGKKARWAIRDRKKFAELVAQIKDLVDGLQEITKGIVPIVLQESAVTNRIATITDVDTLQLVTEACEDDYPILSQTASLKSEILSLPDAKRLEIEAWLADEASLSDPQMAKLENMDLAELKHHLFSLLMERQQRSDDYYGDSEYERAVVQSDRDSRRMFALLAIICLLGSFFASTMGISTLSRRSFGESNFYLYLVATLPFTFTITEKVARLMWLEEMHLPLSCFFLRRHVTGHLM